MERKLPPTMFHPPVAKGQRADKLRIPRGPQFLCSQCETEQNIEDILRSGLGRCVCPNCEENCCEDYCFFFTNGKWYPPEFDMFLPLDTYDRPKNAKEAVSHDEIYNKANEEYKKACEAFDKRYEETKRSYGIE